MRLEASAKAALLSSAREPRPANAWQRSSICRPFETAASKSGLPDLAIFKADLGNSRDPCGLFRVRLADANMNASYLRHSRSPQPARAKIASTIGRIRSL
jgi:hypothetical protein